MSILTTSEVAEFLGVDESTPGLQAAINQAEALTAAEMRLETLEYGSYMESKLLTYTTQQVLPEHGPVRSLYAFEYDEDDYLADVGVDPSGWSVRWDEPRPVREFDRVRSFERLKTVYLEYDAGWTDSEGSYPLPRQVAEYVKMLSGLVLQNNFAQSPDSLELGDMSIQFDRQNFETIKQVYMPAISRHARPY